MSQIKNRISKLEKSTNGNAPYVVTVYGPTEEAVIPDDIGDRKLMVIRVTYWKPPPRDANGNYVGGPPIVLGDDDPIYDRAS